MQGAFIPAGNDASTPPSTIQLFAGSAPVITNRAQGGTNINLAQYQIIAIVADKIVAYDEAGVDGSEVAAGILCTPMDSRASGGVPGRWAPYYTGGDFNHEVLVWPAAIDTLAERRAVFAHTSTIKISTVL